MTRNPEGTRPINAESSANERQESESFESQHGKPERIRRVLREYTQSFNELKNNPEERQLVFAELDNREIPVSQNRKTRKPWVQRWIDLKPRTEAYKKVMISLARYYSEFKRKDKQPIPHNSDSTHNRQSNS
jgi:hypothetical protein